MIASKRVFAKNRAMKNHVGPLGLILALVLLPLPLWSQETTGISSNAAWMWFHRGGLVMYPILILSVIGFGITMERFSVLKAKKLMPGPFLDQVRSFWGQGDFTKLKTLCSQANNPVAKILTQTLGHPGLNPENMELVIERNGQHQAQFLKKNLRILGAIAAISPMLGLLGTVLGMIKAFNVVTGGNPDLVSRNIAEALITTAAGLVVGILALIAYHYFRAKIEAIALEMESFIIELFNSRIPNIDNPRS